MATSRTILLLGMAILAGPVRAERTACRCGFEVAAPDGTPLPLRRATKRAADGRCEFAVRLRVAAADGSARCDGAQVTTRGLPGGGHADWDAGWQRVTLASRGQRAASRAIRARVRGFGAAGRARLLLRCAQPASVAGCEAQLGESVACWVGGEVQPRVVGLDSGTSCRATNGPGTARHEILIDGPDLALWHDRLWRCQGTSASGAFVSVSLDGATEEVVAGPCVATGTDGDSLLVLPHPAFEDGATLVRRNRGRVIIPLAPEPGAPPTVIRAYDVPEAVPGGPSRTVFDLATIPAESPCAGIVPSAITGYGGLLYASGLRPTSGGMPDLLPVVCRFDTRSGATLEPLTLEGFTGMILGLSAIDQDRLLVLSADGVALPPPGYLPEGQPLTTIAPFGAPPQIHVFDAATGARLDTTPTDLGQATGLACVSRSP